MGICYSNDGVGINLDKLVKGIFMKYLLIMLISFVSINVLAGEVSFMPGLQGTYSRASGVGTQAVDGAQLSFEIANLVNVGAFGTTKGVAGPTLGIAINTDAPNDRLELGLMAGKNFNNQNNVYGGYINRTVNPGSDFVVGAWGLSDATMGLSVGYRF